MSVHATDFEALLREALSPIDPPEDLPLRMEATLVSLAEAAQEELEAWELSAMKDPRNWVRPAAALVAGGAAGVGLVVLRTRRRATASRPASLAGLRQVGERAIEDLERETRKLLGDR